MEKISIFIKKINSFLGFISSIITIILIFIDIPIFVIYILLSIILIYIFLMIGYIVRSIFVTDKAQKKLHDSFMAKQSRVADKLHSFFHNLRDYISSYDTDSTTVDNMKEKSINICNYIAEFYKYLFKGYLGDYDISVCIKTINNLLQKNNFTEWEIETFARSTSTSQERHKIDSNPVKVSENSDFEIIISPKYNDDFFAFADMRTIEKDFLETYKKEYINPRGNNFINFYKSTIVVPIRIDEKYIRQDIKKTLKIPKKRNLILGFLCIDSLKTFNTQDEIDIFSLGIEYAKSFGDSLYLFFEKGLIL